MSSKKIGQHQKSIPMLFFCAFMKERIVAKKLSQRSGQILTKVFYLHSVMLQSGEHISDVKEERQ